jgi:hypothetical protein
MKMLVLSLLMFAAVDVKRKRRTSHCCCHGCIVDEYY